ncbi:MAG: hypothetical protein EZS28_017157 [Streblomastix strix]|uniref:Uncharacterized protein n=1 Tax=Streblomastix strix TaxID=222440 RepID=A0A5J4VYM8_9EUKA|nr:MAG: hypothetical protein EZS28_017157 [Streblomastix strix]
MTNVQKRAIEEEISRADPSIRPVDTMAGVLGLTDHKARRPFYRPCFPNSLLQDLYETDLRINNEGSLGSRRQGIAEVQQLNQLQNFVSQRQKEKENQQIYLQYHTESQEDLGQSAMFQDQQPEQTVVQEKLTEKQREAIQKDPIKSENLNIVYDIGAVDRGRPSINDIYNRKHFETYKTGYRYDAQGNPLAYMKKDAPVGSKKQTKMKKNYISTSQLISTSTAQDKLAQKLSGKLQEKKAKKLSSPFFACKFYGEFLALTNFLPISPITSKVRTYGSCASQNVTLTIASQRQCSKGVIYACLRTGQLRVPQNVR